MEVLLLTGHKKLGEMTVKKLLVERPYWKVSLSNFGAEARRTLHDNNFDAAVIDVVHSNGAAFDMLSELSADHPALPVVAVLSSSSNGIAEKIDMYCDSSYVCNVKDTEECINTIERACN